MNDPQNLRIPGPTPIPPSVFEAMQRPMIPHRSDEFRSFHLGLLAKLKTILKTNQNVFVVPGSGSIGWEAAITNTLSPGDQVLSFVTGDFGARFAGMASKFGLHVSQVVVEPGQSAGVELVQRELARHPDVKAVLYTHNETSTGVINPLNDIGPLVRDHGALLLVDAVSSAGAITIETDAWGVDVLLTGSQKGWMCPPGLAILVVSDRAMEAGTRSSFPRSFLDFASWQSNVEKGSTPATPPLTMYFALDAACALILEEGMEVRTARHEEAARRTRRAIQEAGLELLADESCSSPTVTAIRVPGGHGAGQLVQQVRERYDIDVAAGQSDLSDKIIRIGHMGWFQQEDIARAVTAVVACATVMAE
jgi:aspartate aminotransferase-like enzyme